MPYSRSALALFPARAKRNAHYNEMAAVLRAMPPPSSDEEPSRVRARAPCHMMSSRRGLSLDCVLSRRRG